MKDETLAVHAGYTTDPTSHAVTTPIYQTVAYEFDNAQHGADLFDLAVPGNIYSRIMNPTCDVLEQRIAALEGGVGALAVSAGSAAIHYAIINIAQAGDNIVTVPQLYGGTYTLFAHMFPALGIDVRFAADDSVEALEWACSNTLLALELVRESLNDMRTCFQHALEPIGGGGALS